MVDWNGRKVHNNDWEGDSRAQCGGHTETIAGKFKHLPPPLSVPVGSQYPSWSWEGHQEQLWAKSLPRHVFTAPGGEWRRLSQVLEVNGGGHHRFWSSWYLGVALNGAGCSGNPIIFIVTII